MNNTRLGDGRYVIRQRDGRSQIEYPRYEQTLQKTRSHQNGQGESGYQLKKCVWEDPNARNRSWTDEASDDMQAGSAAEHSHIRKMNCGMWYDSGLQINWINELTQLFPQLPHVTVVQPKG
jgi:hypothetical protein